MRTYLITYDLASSARRSLASAIMQLGAAWARPLETTWYVQSAERADALERLLKRADKALYAAKRDGRNRVVVDAA